MVFLCESLESCSERLFEKLLKAGDWGRQAPEHAFPAPWRHCRQGAGRRKHVRGSAPHTLPFQTTSEGRDETEEKLTSIVRVYGAQVFWLQRAVDACELGFDPLDELLPLARPGSVGGLFAHDGQLSQAFGPDDLTAGLELVRDLAERLGVVNLYGLAHVIQQQRRVLGVGFE